MSRKKKYDPVEFLLASAVLSWNDGAALDEDALAYLSYLEQVQARAIRASRGKMSTVRDMNTKRNNAVCARWRVRASEYGLQRPRRR